jgi:hypothetical protein
MPDGVYIPKELDDAHRELKNMLPKELISEMKRGTEDDMVQLGSVEGFPTFRVL